MSQPKVVELLDAMIQFPSLSETEDEICTFMQSYVTDAGIQNERTGNSLHFWLGSGPNRLLMASHLDVVPASSDHPYPPFTATHVHGKIYGRGASDAKASGAAMTTALLELAEEHWEPEQGCLIVALTECEETDYDKNGLKNLLETKLSPPQAALIGEPTNLCPVVAQKGLLIVRLTAHGKSAHAARHTLGENAILKASDDIHRLSDLTFDRIHPILGEITMNVTTIQGGTARNVIPDECVIYLDIRSTPSYTHDDLIQIIHSCVKSEVTIHSDRIIPVSTEIEESIVQACLHARPGNQPQGSPTASDWIYLSGIPAVKIGPGSSELSHTSDEHVEEAELIEAVAFYKAAVKEYFHQQ